MTDTGFEESVGEPHEPTAPLDPAPLDPAPLDTTQLNPAQPEPAPDALLTPVPAFGASVLAEGVPLTPPPPPLPPDPEIAARRARRKRNAVRWTGAVALVAVVGGGIGYALTLPKRTHLPGLGTTADGRFNFPALSLPALPAGQFPPDDAGDNPGAQHIADIRLLLLPLPQGAVAVESLPGRTGWLSASAAAALSTDPTMGSTFTEFGLRHTAAEGWTEASDGSTTKVYVLQFVDGGAATAAAELLSEELYGLPDGASQTSFKLTAGNQATYSVVKSAGKVTREGSFSAGDAIVIVIQSGPANLPMAPFEQVLTLQNQLLQ